MTRERLYTIMDDILVKAATEYNFGVNYDNGPELAQFLVDELIDGIRLAEVVDTLKKS